MMSIKKLLLTVSISLIPLSGIAAKPACPPASYINAASASLNKFTKEWIWGPLYEYYIYSDQPAFNYNNHSWYVSVNQVGAPSDGKAFSMARQTVSVAKQGNDGASSTCSYLSSYPVYASTSKLR